MKKIIPFLVLALAASSLSPTRSRAESTGAFGLGVHGGINLSDLDVKRSGSATINNVKENKTGPVVGAHLELGSDMVVIRPEANYSVRGYTFLGAAEVQQKFLEIPVLAKVHVLPGAIQPFVEIGPQLGIHLGDDVSLLGATTTFDNDSSSIDLSGVAGAGVRLGLGDQLAIEGEARYVFGFTDTSSRDDIEVKTRGFQLLAGLTFRY